MEFVESYSEVTEQCFFLYNDSIRRVISSSVKVVVVTQARLSTIFFRLK